MVHDPEQVEGRARQPVELGHHQHVASLQLVEHARQLRPLGSNARHLLAEYPLDTRSLEDRFLRRQRLPGRGDTDLANRGHGGTPILNTRRVVGRPFGFFQDIGPQHRMTIN